MINRNESLTNIERLSKVRSKSRSSIKIINIDHIDHQMVTIWPHGNYCINDTNELVDHVGALRQLVDDFSNNVRSLKSLREPVEHWDILLMHLLETKLHLQAYEAWGLRVFRQDRQKILNDLQIFLEQRCKFSYNNYDCTEIKQITSVVREPLHW